MGKGKKKSGSSATPPQGSQAEQAAATGTRPARSETVGQRQPEPSPVQPPAQQAVAAQAPQQRTPPGAPHQQQTAFPSQGGRGSGSGRGQGHDRGRGYGRGRGRGRGGDYRHDSGDGRPPYPQEAAAQPSGVPSDQRQQRQQQYQPQPQQKYQQHPQQQYQPQQQQQQYQSQPQQQYQPQPQPKYQQHPQQQYQQHPQQQYQQHPQQKYQPQQQQQYQTQPQQQHQPQPQQQFQQHPEQQYQTHPQQQYQPQPHSQDARGRGRWRGRGRGRGAPPFSPRDASQTPRESPDAPSSAPSTLPQHQVPPSAQQMQPSGPPPQRQQRPPSAQQMHTEGAYQQSPKQQQPQSQKDGEIAQKMKNLSLDTLHIPVRPDIEKGGTKGRKTVVDTNHLRLDISKLKNEIVMHYDVEINPDRPKRLFRSAIEAFRQAHFPTRNPVFDGRKNLISTSYLPGLGQNEELSARVNITDPERDRPDRPIQFEIKMKWVADVDLTCLKSYMTEETNLELPQKAIQALDIVIRNAPAQRFTQVGRSFFTTPEQVIPLGNGMHMWLGFFQSVILGWKPFLNVDVAHKGFPAPKKVTDIMDEVVGSRFNPFNPEAELNSYQLADLTAFLRGLKVEYKLPNQNTSKRIYRVNSAVLSASRQEFKLADGKVITVLEYFRRDKNYTIRYPNLPCLHVGAQNRASPIYLPAELCTIVEGQVTFRKMNEQQTSAMIKYAATSTVDRRKKIENAIRKANYNSDPAVKEFGISISNQFESVNARILDAPHLIYANKQTVRPNAGKWQVKPFLRSSSLNSWFIINYRTRVSTDELWRFAAEMKKVGTNLGMQINTAQDVIPLDRRAQPNKLYGLLADLKKSGAELAVVIIDDKRVDYAQVKQFAELRVGLLTQCLKVKTVSRLSNSTVQNILLKVNSKLNGVNHNLALPMRPPCLQKPTMIIGADVTHPSPDQRNIPSVAAVCASHDPDAFQYNIQYRLQPPRMEIIQDLAAIMKSHLWFFYNKAGCKPERLIFYRDGVSEGQFSMVLSEELRQIRDACRGLNESYQPPITFLVVQKRHHTRFFPKKPEDEDGRNKNVPAGTIVDTDITHPRHIDFYLVSHASIQGVSRPTKYRTLWDDSNMSMDELEELTYYLCHLFARCTRSVSYPAPTYYAHLAAFRARMYIEGQNVNLDNLADEQARRNITDNIIRESPMFFV